MHWNIQYVELANLSVHVSMLPFNNVLVLFMEIGVNKKFWSLLEYLISWSNYFDEFWSY